MRFRFSVRKMLIVITVLALGLGWVANRLRIARENQRLVAELWAMQAIATLDDGTVPNPSNSRGLGAILAALRISSIRHIRSDDVLAKVAKLKVVDRIGIMGPVTDQGLATLASWPSLRELSISSEAISDHGLSQLSGLVNLETLDLTGQSLSDDSLQFVKNMRRLKVLRLAGSCTTNAIKAIDGTQS